MAKKQAWLYVSPQPSFLATARLNRFYSDPRPPPDVKCPDPFGPVDFVPADGHEVDGHGVYVHGYLSYRLGGVGVKEGLVGPTQLTCRVQKGSG